MIDLLRRWRPGRATLLLFVIAGIAACSGQSCSCMAPIPGGFPESKRHVGGVQTRFTSSFMDYVSDNAPQIVPNLLPGGTTFNVPPSCSGSQKICCGTPQPTCQMSVVPTALQLTPSAPSSLHFSADLIVRSLENIPVDTSIGHCVVSFDTTRAGPVFLTASGDVTLPVDGTTRLTGLSLANANIDGIDNSDLHVDEDGSDTACAVAALGIVKGFIIDYVEGQVGDIVTGVVKGQLCQSCSDVSDCPQAAMACTNMQCIGADGTCIQQLGVQGRADVGSFLASYSPGLQAHIDLMEAAGGYANADTGLSLGILGGAQADPHNACVPLVSAPAPTDVSPSPSFTGDVVPGTSTPYHVGIGLHVSHLETLGFALWDAGTLCLSASSASITQLSAKTLEIIMPSISDLIHADDAPAMIKLRPQMPPDFVLGAGTFKTDANGHKSVDQPLVTVRVPSLAVDLYLFIEDRYVRIATVNGDLSLPLGLDTDGNGAFLLIPGDLSGALTNVTVTNADLLAEHKADLEAAFPSLITLAIGPLVGNLPPLALPTLAGLSVMPKVITSVDPDPNGTPTFVAVYADVNNTTSAAHRAVETTASVESVFVPPTQVFDIAHRDGREPSVTVHVQGSDGPFEWTYAFDDGMWHAFQPTSTLTLTDPALWLQGQHRVRVRGRIVGQPATLDPTPTELAFWVDSEAPTGTFVLDGARIIVSAHDRLSASSALRYRIGTGPFVGAEALGIATGDPSVLDVEVRDEAGNVSRLRYDGPQHASGCDVGHGSPVSLFAFALVGALFLARRRRLTLALLLMGCHHGGTKAPPMGAQLDPMDAIGSSHDVKGHGSTIHITAYDKKFGDLGYATVETGSLTKAPTWSIVDGVDTSSMPSGTSMYRDGISTPGPDVGLYSSLALTSDGKPRVAYYDATNHALKYATGPYPFATQTVQTGSASTAAGTITDVGTFPALYLDSNDEPAIVYAATGMGSPTSGFTSELRLARAKSAAPASAADWTVSTVDTIAISCGGRCDSGSACITQPMVNGMPNTDSVHSSCIVTDVAACTPVCSGTDVCIDGVCTAVVAPHDDGDLPEGTGLFNNFIKAPNGQPTIVYYDHSSRALRVATVIDNTFAPETIDGGNAGEDFGQHVSAAYDTSGTLHMAYVDAVLNQLDYRALAGSGQLSARAVVDSGLRGDGSHLVGASASLLVTGSNVSILYQDQTLAQLELASGPSGFKHTDFLSNEDDVGFSSHQLALGSNVYYSTYRIDRTGKPFGFLELGKVQ